MILEFKRQFISVGEVMTGGSHRGYSWDVGNVLFPETGVSDIDFI